MKIVVPHTTNGLRRETREAVLPFSPDFHLLRGDTDYHDLIASLWGEDFIIVEQDVVPAPGDIKGLVECPHLWCAFAYDYPPFGLYAGMGLCKFSAKLARQWPQAMRFCALESDAKHPRKHFCRVDGWLQRYLRERGCSQHGHGVVAHLHCGGPAHGCVGGFPDEKVTEVQVRGAFRE